MNDPLLLLLAAVAGIALGLLFYGGLWWTIRKSMASPRPALWILVSLLVRMGITLAGFYVVAGTHWERLVLCLLGFMAARAGVTWATRLPVEPGVGAKQKASHAP
ncbi:ATP synthase subunit I [Actimicrobium antarcticum]|uniref:ATP synthase subunit I n=1 Tax=Actimicrobium antarcticum TaxID=1051899 RepID=A0ABP7TF80_9BURK